MGSVC